MSRGSGATGHRDIETRSWRTSIMENVKYRRSADQDIYRNPDWENPKECFKQMSSMLGISGLGRDHSLLDVGCAAGESLYHYRTVNPDMRMVGVEYLQSLVDSNHGLLATRNIELLQGDANNLAFENASFDFTVSSGVTCIFNDFEPCFNEMIRVTKSGGRCINLIPLNEMDVDVLIGYRNPLTKSHEAGWNKFAIKTVKEYLEAHPRVKNHSFEKFELPFDLEKRDEDLLRTWTVVGDDGRRRFWNGLNTEISQYFIIFDIV